MEIFCLNFVDIDRFIKIGPRLLYKFLVVAILDFNLILILLVCHNYISQIFVLVRRNISSWTPSTWVCSRLLSFSICITFVLRIVAISNLSPVNSFGIFDFLLHSHIQKYRRQWTPCRTFCATFDNLLIYSYTFSLFSIYIIDPVLIECLLYVCYIFSATL